MKKGKSTIASFLAAIVITLTGVDNYITKYKVNALVLVDNQTLSAALSLFFKNQTLLFQMAENTKKIIHEN